MNCRTNIVALIAFAILSVGFIANLFQVGRSVPPRLNSLVPTQPGSQATTTTESAHANRPKRPGQRQADTDFEPFLAHEQSHSHSIETVRAIQRELQRLGYDPGGLTGNPGLVTRAAILAFQHDRGQTLSAEADEALLETLIFSSRNPASRQSTNKKTLPAGNAKRVIRVAQKHLRALGYTVGPLDGQPGQRTRHAIGEYESLNGWKRTGRVSGRLMRSLARSATSQARTSD